MNAQSIFWGVPDTPRPEERSDDPEPAAGHHADSPCPARGLRQRRDCGNDGAATPAAPPPPEVGVLTIERRELQLHVELPGRTSAYLVAEVRPQVSGIIRERRFTEGAEVDRGAPLYVIDPDTYQAEVATAEAALAKAEAAANTARLRAERFRALVARHAVSRQDADDANAAEQQAVAEVAQQRAQLARARIDLQRTRITAPISGDKPTSPR